MYVTQTLIKTVFHGSWLDEDSSPLQSATVLLFLSTTNKMQRYTIFFIAVSAVHVWSGYSAHRQELKNCTCSIGYLSNLFAATANMGESEPVLTHPRCCMYSF
jgi:hypothetical protein